MALGEGDAVVCSSVRTHSWLGSHPCAGPDESNTTTSIEKMEMGTNFLVSMP